MLAAVAFCHWVRHWHCHCQWLAAEASCHSVLAAVASCHWVLAAVGSCDWLPAVPSVFNCHVVDNDDLDCQRSRQASLVGSIIASAAEMAESLNIYVKAWHADAAKPPCLDNGIA